MRLLRVATAFLPLALLCASGAAPARMYTFPNGIDALSAALPGDGESTVRYREADGDWSQWISLVRENEQDPALTESNLIMLPAGTTTVEVRTKDAGFAMHPIVVSHEPPHVEFAALSGGSRPFILTRNEWGADESFLVRAPTPSSASSSSNASTTPDTNVGDNGGGGSTREQDCRTAQLNYPDEFKVTRTTTTTPDGDTLRWAWTYSPQVKLLVVHHTAVMAGGETRSGTERMRALYQYHANNRAWGDIGYHYVIDDAGQVYEGKSGGKSVVAGHAYCNNVGTVGISLMGNFDEERPTQAQVKALQKLLSMLAETYGIDLDTNVTYHGVSRPPIVGHRDLVSTDCPGFAMYGALEQVRRHVRDDDLDAEVTFPVWPESSTKPHVDREAERRSQRLRERGIDPNSVPTSSSSSSRVNGRTAGLFVSGGSELHGRPGMRTRLSVTYTAGSVGLRQGASAGDIWRSDSAIGLWLVDGTTQTRLRRTLNVPAFVRPGESLQMTLELQFPVDTGTTTLTLGDVSLTLVTDGRRMRDLPDRSQALPPNRSSVSSSRSSSSRASSASSRPYPRPSSSSSVRSATSSSAGTVSVATTTIRVRLTTEGESLAVTLPANSTAGGLPSSGPLTLTKDGERCATTVGSRSLSESVLRLAPAEGGITSLTVNSTTTRTYRGVLECRVIADKLTIINELHLDDYLHGISEEPDTEPYEKQRAFAVAARTYAAYYMDPLHRKFPDQPYDGSDSPAEFQAYAGAGLEQNNPNWVKAVDSTANLVLTVDSELLKTPYFSSDDGRTRSPSEAGWPNFPHAAVFASKPDPWCDGMENRGHGVGMSGCGAEAQANEGKTAEEILNYYYTGVELRRLNPR